MPVLRWVAVVLLLAGCGAPPPDAAALGARIHAMGERDQWAEALPLAKELALAYPGHAGAHYLLGKAYLHRPEPFLGQALGELRTALRITKRTGETQAPWAAGDDNFLLGVYRGLALVHFRWIREAMGVNAPSGLIRARLLQAKTEVESGLQIDPTDSFLLEMRATIDEYLAGPFKDPAAKAA